MILMNLAAGNAQPRSDYDELFHYGARSSAMGHAIISDGRDAGIMFRNPAALAVLQTGSVFFDHRGQAEHAAMGHTLGFVAPTGRNGRLGVAVSANHQGQAYLAGEGFDALMYSLTFAQSLLLAQSFSAGVLAETEILKAERLETLNITTILGPHYSPSPEISYALTLSGVGMSTMLRTNTLHEVELKPQPATLGIGMSMRFPSSYDQQDFTLALVNEKQFGTAGLTYRFGIEYYPADVLALRAGLVSGPFEQAARFGLGIRTEPFLVDIAYAPGNGRYHVSTFIVW